MVNSDRSERETVIELEYLDHLGFGNTEFEYRGKRYPYVQIEKIKYSATSTKHSINLIPTGTTYEVDLKLVMGENIVLAIKPESSFMGHRSKTRYEAVMKAASIFMNITFTQRVNRYEEILAAKKFVQWGQIQIHQNGDLFKNNQFRFNIKSAEISVTLSVFTANFFKKNNGFLEKLKSAFSSTGEVIDLTVDKDCFLYIMKHQFGLTWQNTPVPEKSKDAREIFNEALAILGAKLSAADGTMSPEELDQFQKYFGIDEKSFPNFRSTFFQAAKDSRTPSEVAKLLFDLLSAKREALEFLLAGLIQVAAADGEFHANELAIIRSVAVEFGFSSQELDQLIAIFATNTRTKQKSSERSDNGEL